MYPNLQFSQTGDGTTQFIEDITTNPVKVGVIGPRLTEHAVVLSELVGFYFLAQVCLNLFQNRANNVIDFF